MPESANAAMKTAIIAMRTRLSDAFFLNIGEDVISEGAIVSIPSYHLPSGTNIR